jgi:hypothetical protein
VNVPHLDQLLRTADPDHEFAKAVANFSRTSGVVAVSDQRWGIGFYTGRPLAHLEHVSPDRLLELLGGEDPSRAAEAVVISDSCVRRLVKKPGLGKVGRAVPRLLAANFLFKGTETLHGDTYRLYMHRWVERPRPALSEEALPLAASPAGGREGASGDSTIAINTFSR